MDEFDCENCRGTGQVPYKKIHLIDPCNKCRGKGKVDWIEYITNQSVHPPLQPKDYEETMYYNIQLLHRELVDLCMKMNIQARVDFQPMEDQYSALKPQILYPSKFGGT